MKHLYLLVFVCSQLTVSAQVIDPELECPLVISPEYILSHEITSLTVSQTYGNVKRSARKKANAMITYYFDTAGVPYMKVVKDMQTQLVDSMLMNHSRCEFVDSVESPFFESGIMCNERGQVVGNETPSQRTLYRYDSLDRLLSQITIIPESDGLATISYMGYGYNAGGKIYSIIEKEGVLTANLGERKQDTVYKTSFHKTIVYTDEKMSDVITYTKDNVGKEVAVSAFKYFYKQDVLTEVLLYAMREKDPVYSLKVLKIQ